MESIKSFLSRHRTLLGVLVFLSITAAVVFAFKKTQSTAGLPPVEVRTGSNREITPPSGAVNGSSFETAAPRAGLFIDDNTAKVVLRVKNMSCSGCISTIKGSLKGIAGIKKVIVDVANGEAEVYFDRTVLADVSSVAGAITASGYPASVQRVVAAEELKKERDIAAAKSKSYIASVGGWDIARSDFNAELEIARKRYAKIYGEAVLSGPKGGALLSSLKAQILSNLIDEGIFLQEIQRTGFKVDAQTVEKHLKEFLDQNKQTLEELHSSLSEAGYYIEYFNKKFENKVLITTYLNERILADAANEFEKQNAFNTWYKNSKILSEVVYYDREIQGLLQAQSGSSGCCAVK